jgi:hypothetical protein
MSINPEIKRQNPALYQSATDSETAVKSWWFLAGVKTQGVSR